MKSLALLSLVFFIFLFFIFKPTEDDTRSDYDVYQYVKECKAELGISRKLPQLSCLDGQEIPIFVNKQEIQSDNWNILSDDKKCDNPHWLGGDMGCWTYSHLQVLKLDAENIMVLNCRQKGNTYNKDWFRKTTANLGMNQQQRKEQYESAVGKQKTDRYYLYNTFNDIGLILRNIRTGKSCYLTQYGTAVTGFLPPLDRALPRKDDFLASINPNQSRPPKDFPQNLWYRDANQAFRAPAFTAEAGCIDCHNAHGFKYSPYLNANHGLPNIISMKHLPMLLVGKPFKNHFRKANFLQITTAPIDGKEQLCTQCHKMTTSGTCGMNLEFATGHPDADLHKWLTVGSDFSWMPPIDEDLTVIKKHLAAIKCCCNNPNAKGCRMRKFGPTQADLPAGFNQGKGWVNGQQDELCQGILESIQWNANAY